MRTILIVDDSAFSRSRIKECLEGGEYSVTEADSGTAALGMVRASPPNCLILDLLMPGMGGLEVMARMREENITVPVVVLTADIQKTTASRCRDLGAAAVVNKPCSRERLADLWRPRVITQTPCQVRGIHNYLLGRESPGFLPATARLRVQIPL